MNDTQLSINEFCDKHDACLEGRIWAADTCDSMADVWATAKPDWLIWVATRPDVLTGRELRLFACWSVRQVWHLLTDERSKTAVEVAARFAVGDATADELAAVRAAARAAARTAAWDAARATADELAAAWDAAWDAAWVAARDAQAKWLRDNTIPNFGGEI